MKYRVTQPFIAFGKTTDVGDVVELTEEQAKVLTDMDSVSAYEVKIKPPPENKMKPARKKKSSRSVHPAPASRKRTAKK